MVSERNPGTTQPAGEQKAEVAIRRPEATITQPHQTYLSQEQIRQLLTMVDRLRVQQVQGKSNMAAYDIRAHLNRIFGFGRWSGRVTTMELIYESQVQLTSGKPGYDIAYKAGYELTVKAPAGNILATYTEYAVGAQKMGVVNRGDCHDFAMKTAESQALKRAATNLGDQFGLSLYNKGSFNALIGGTFLYPGRLDPTELAGPTEQLHEETDPDIIVEAEQAQEPQQRPQQQAPTPQPQPQPTPAAPAPPQPQEQEPVEAFPEGSIEANRVALFEDIKRLPAPNKQRLMNLWGKTDLPPAYHIATEDQLARAWGLYGQCVPGAPAPQEQPQEPAPASPAPQPAPQDDNNFYAVQA